jgi:hypothetical protein
LILRLCCCEGPIDVWSEGRQRGVLPRGIHLSVRGGGQVGQCVVACGLSCGAQLQLITVYLNYSELSPAPASGWPAFAPPGCFPSAACPRQTRRSHRPGRWSPRAAGTAPVSIGESQVGSREADGDRLQGVVLAPELRKPKRNPKQSAEAACNQVNLQHS